MSVRNLTNERPRRRRCYTVPQLLKDLEISRSQFYHLLRSGHLPFLEELLPRIGQRRYRADPIDRYFENRWQQGRA
jgi:predicted DNA-binding transcriptional regulator AlpA